MSVINRTISACLAGFAGLGIAYAAPFETNINGIPWYDTTGNTIDAHGMTFTKVGNYYYMFGTARENSTGQYDNILRAIKVYRSTDLQNWEFRGDAVTEATLPGTGTGSRPHVIYNDATGKYVMYMKRKTGGSKYSAILTSDTIDGQYAFHGYFNPTCGNAAGQGLFKDDDGTAYLVYSETSSADGHQGRSICIDQLSADYLSSTGNSTRVWQGREGPQIFKANGKYFLVTSGVTGWDGNQNKYRVSDNVLSGWSGAMNIGNGNMYESQINDVLTLNGATGTTHLYIGDRHDGNYLGDSTYLWLPIKFNAAGDRITIDYYDAFNLDLATGEWSEGYAPKFIDNVGGGVTGRLRRETGTSNVGTGSTSETGASSSWRLISDQASQEHFVDRDTTNASLTRMRRTAGSPNAILDSNTKTGNNPRFRFRAAGNGAYYIDCKKGGRLRRENSPLDNVTCGAAAATDDDAKWTISD